MMCGLAYLSLYDFFGFFGFSNFLSFLVTHLKRHLTIQIPKEITTNDTFLGGVHTA